MNLHSIDLKLLVVFDAVMGEGSVTRAGRRLGMSQPAISSSLNRLRHLLKDDLFLRVAGGVRPTPRALELALPLHGLLLQLQWVLEPNEFSPATAERTFTLAMPDHLAALIIPKLISFLRSKSPGIRVRVGPKSNAHFAMQLDTGKVDFVVGIVPDVPARFRRVLLYNESFQCVMRHQHPLAEQGHLTLNQYFAADHLAVTPFGDSTSHIDHIFHKHGLKREIVASVNQYLMAPGILHQTDLILTGFKHTIDNHPAFDQLHKVPFPLNVDPVEISMLWNHVLSHNLAHNWFRETLERITRDQTSSYAMTSSD